MFVESGLLLLILWYHRYCEAKDYSINNPLLRHEKYTDANIFLQGERRFTHIKGRMWRADQATTVALRLITLSKHKQKKRHILHVHRYVQIYSNQGQLVASSHCVPHCHFEISLSRLKQKHLQSETELKQCLCDSFFQSDRK